VLGGSRVKSPQWTPVNVKLLLPPRHSRGNSPVGLEREAASKRSQFAAADRSILYRARAAYCLWDAGEFDRARPILKEITTFDWKGGRLWADRHDTEKAYSRLILEAAVAQDLDRVESLWGAAVSRCSSLAWDFPKIVTEQKKLLAAAIAMQHKNICRYIVERLDARLLSKHHDLQLLRTQAERI
jgi:hypothetical protein